MLFRYPEYEELYRAPRYSITVNTVAKNMTLFRDGKVFKTYLQNFSADKSHFLK